MCDYGSAAAREERGDSPRSNNLLVNMVPPPGFVEYRRIKDQTQLLVDLFQLIGEGFVQITCDLAALYPIGYSDSMKFVKSPGYAAFRRTVETSLSALQQRTEDYAKPVIREAERLIEILNAAEAMDVSATKSMEILSVILVGYDGETKECLDAFKAGGIPGLINCLVVAAERRGYRLTAIGAESSDGLKLVHSNGQEFEIGFLGEEAAYATFAELFKRAAK